MLWPFNRQRLSIYKTNPEFLTTIVGDMCQRIENFQGYVSVVGDDKNLTILVTEGKPVYSALCTINGEILPLQTCSPVNALKDFGVEATILVMELDQLLAAVMSIFFSTPPDISAAGDVMHYSTGLEAAAAGGELFALNLVHDGVSMPAVFERGNLSAWFYFDREKGEFVQTKDEALFRGFVEANHASCKFDFYLGAAGEPKPFEVNEESDPFIQTAKTYFALYEEIRRVIIRATGQRGNAEFQQILNAFREKYPPLYQGLFVNPETNEIWWEQLLENRKKITHKFRYDSYFLYLDEFLLTLIRKLFQTAGVQGIVEIIRFLDKRRRVEFQPSYNMSKILYTKLNNLLRLDRYTNVQPAGK